jgi:L-ascorbate metabolism protein UlaG (beta-lactamase superfamily)
MNIQYLSWAGFKLEVGKTTLFVDASQDSTTDPKPECNTANCHAVVSHHHGDHADMAALKSVFNEVCLGGESICMNP